MFVASVDIETTGLNPDVHSTIQIGIVFGDIHKPEKDVHRLQLDIWPENVAWSTYCLELHRNWLENVRVVTKTSAKDGHISPFIAPHEVYQNLETFFQKLGAAGKVTVAGKNFGSFDLQFLKKFKGPGHKTVADLFRVRTFDPTILYVLPNDEAPPDLATCKKRAMLAGCKAFTSDVVLHDAVSDAEDVWDLLHFKLSC